MKHNAERLRVPGSPIFLTVLLLSHFSHFWLCATPSLGFSRQEHWSGLPFPSPMHKSEKWKWSCSVMSDSSKPHGLQPTRLLRPWDFPGKSTGVGCHCFLQIVTPCKTIAQCHNWYSQDTEHLHQHKDLSPTFYRHTHFPPAWSSP